jgi:hypothetical protein
MFTLHDLIEPVIRAAHGDRVTLGNVEFWIDADGPWVGQLSYSIPANEWDRVAVQTDLMQRLQPIG